MIAAHVLDVLLVLILLVYLGEGFRRGFARSISAIIGIVAGGVLAFFAIPLVAAAVPVPFWRTVAVVAVAVLLLGGGHGAGAVVGTAIARRGSRGDRTRGLDGVSAIGRLGGAAVNGAAAILVVALVASGVGILGVPILSSAAAQSTVLRVIDAITPPPVDSVLARVRSAILEQELPTIGEALGGVATSPGVPDVATDTDALTAAARSVVRISGTAYACGQNQSGSGFVIADDRIVTNAHVIAGVAKPIVETRDGQAIEGRVVYFDPADDLAVIAVDALTASPLSIAPVLGVGDGAVVDGYPYGGPFVTGAAEVLAVSTERIADIYGRTTYPREVYSLAATVNPGNSGGPLLTTGGRIAGVVFARSSTDANLGYAMTNTELQPVVDAAPGLSAAVTPGACVKG